MSVKSTSRVMMLVILVALILAIIYPFLSRYQASFLTSIFTYLTLTIGWSIFSGYTGYISLATSAFFGIGAYTAIFAIPIMPFPLAFALGGVVSAAVGLLVGLVTLRLKGLYFMIFSFVLNFFAQNLFLYGIFANRETAGIILSPVSDEVIYYSLLIAAFGAIATSAWMRRSLYGLALASIGQDELKAEVVGLNTTLFKIVALCMSATFIGVAGAISIQRFYYIDPYVAFSLRNTFEPVIMAIVGGAGTFLGPVFGAITIGCASELFVTRFPLYYQLFLGLLLVLFVVFAPKGITGTDWLT
ncbi:MAG: branched-chain amino acid ABC transporter permease, partial [Candidatus Methanomethyliaceae archaeon]